MVEKDRFVVEIERIRDVYTARVADPVAHDRHRPSRAGNQIMVQEAWNQAIELVRQHATKPLTSCRILDVGCGAGSFLGWLQSAQGIPAHQLAGVDLVPSSIAKAQARFPEQTFVVGNSAKLDFPDASRDLVSVFTVFSSILDLRVADSVAQDIDRVLTPGGAVLWYDMRYPNPWNRDIRAIGTKAVSRLFPGYSYRIRSITLLPPLARRLGRFTESVYPILARLPWLQSHLIGLLIKPSL